MVIVLDDRLSLTRGRAALRCRCQLSRLRLRLLGRFRFLRFLWVHHLLFDHFLAFDTNLEVLSGDLLESCGFIVFSHVINHLVRDLSHVVQELILACVWNGEVLAMTYLRLEHGLNALRPLHLLTEQQDVAHVLHGPQVC